MRGASRFAAVLHDCINMKYVAKHAKQLLPGYLAHLYKGRVPAYLQ